MKFQTTRKTSLFLLMAALSFFSVSQGGCASQKKGEKTKGGKLEALSQRARNKNLVYEGLQVTEEDINADGAPDQFVYTNGGVKIRVERDINFDGKTNFWQHFEDGVLVEEELDLDFDGNVDAIHVYIDDVLDHKKISVDFRNDFTITKYYTKDGDLIRVERDIDHDGTIDLIDYYENNERTRTELKSNKDN